MTPQSTSYNLVGSWRRWPVASGCCYSRMKCAFGCIKEGVFKHHGGRSDVLLQESVSAVLMASGQQIRGLAASLVLVEVF